VTSGGPAGFNLPSLRLARGSRGEYGQKRCIASTPTAAARWAFYRTPPPPLGPDVTCRASCSSRRGSRRPAATSYDGWGVEDCDAADLAGQPVPRSDGRAAPSGAARPRHSTPAA